MLKLYKQINQTKQYQLKKKFIMNNITFEENKIPTIEIFDVETSLTHTCLGSCINCEEKPCIFFNENEINKTLLEGFSYNPSITVCPTNSIEVNGYNQICINHSSCILCGLCINRCNYGALYFDSTSNNINISNEINHNFFEETTNLNTLESKEITLKKGSLIKKETFISLLPLILSKIDRIHPDDFNLLVRNLLISQGIPTNLTRKGDVFFRMDGIFNYDCKIGSLEIENSTDSLSAIRRTLDNIAVLNSKYKHDLKNIIPVIIFLNFPNKRADYWNVITDIKNVLSIDIVSLNIFVLLFYSWNFKQNTLWNLINYKSDLKNLFESEFNQFLESTK